MKKIVFVLFSCCLATMAIAQTPVQWSFTAKKTGDKTFEIRMTATIQPGWSIYAQATPEGGPLPTSVGFGVNPLLKREGTVKEVGKQLKKFEELFGVDVLYYKDKVEFVQVVQLKRPAKTNISGWVEFMACNDEQCLPPKKQNFTLTLN